MSKPVAFRVIASRPAGAQGSREYFVRCGIPFYFNKPVVVEASKLTEAQVAELTSTPCLYVEALDKLPGSPAAAEKPPEKTPAK